MRGFKLYAIIVVISCLALQEASCSKKNKFKNKVKTVSDEEDEIYEKANYVQEPEPEEEETGGPYDCEEYKSKIWEKAFSSKEVVMPLVDSILETAKMMGTDEVCSDTTRALFNFIDVIGTNNFAFYSIRSMYKMITVIIRDTDTSSEIYKETQKVVTRILTDPPIRELTLLSIMRPLKMLKNKVVRERALRTFKAIAKLVIPPPKTETKTDTSLSRSSSIKTTSKRKDGPNKKVK